MLTAPDAADVALERIATRAAPAAVATLSSGAG